MTNKNLYDLLGVSENATPEQIRRAYVLRCKMLHPDRFDQKLQRAEWELANEILKELNQAYGILSDPTARAHYDHTIPRAAFHQPPPQHREPQPSPQRNVPLGHLKSGICYYEYFPPSIQQALSERISGINKIQYAIKLHGVGRHYFWALVHLSWFVILFCQAFENQWSGESFGCILSITAVAAIFQAFNINWIIRWHRSPLHCWLLVTPLYIIKTHLDRVWYWPILEVSDIKATHRYLNGVYYATSVRMKLGLDRHEFQILPQSAYDSMLGALHVFEQKYHTAKHQGDGRYFFEQDDFRDFDPGTVSTRLSHARNLRTACIFILSFAFFGVAFVTSSFINSKQSPFPKIRSDVPMDTTTYSPQPPPTSFLEPEFPLPSNGEIQTYTSRERDAPFEIKSTYGSNYLLKLADASNGQPVLTVFVRGGNTVNLDVPVGNYVVKYASGDKWYGYRYLFGPTTGYSKADDTFTFRYNGTQVSGYTITLYKVQNGNLKTEAINPNEF